MKLIKRILFVIFLLIALVLIIGLFAPKEFIGKAEITINKPNQEVFDYIKYLKNQDNYGVWNLKDPNMKKDFFGEDGTEGFIYEWESTKFSVGKGKQVISNIVEGQKMESLLYFNNSSDFSVSQISTHIISDNQTKVEWIVLGKMPYPVNAIGLFIKVDGDLQQGLENLKKELEK